MVGADAPEIIEGLAIAVKARLAKHYFDRTVAIHPTAAAEIDLVCRLNSGHDPDNEL